MNKSDNSAPIRDRAFEGTRGFSASGIPQYPRFDANFDAGQKEFVPMHGKKKKKKRK